jgi:hypothetical protein
LEAPEFELKTKYKGREPLYFNIRYKYNGRERVKENILRNWRRSRNHYDEPYSILENFLAIDQPDIGISLTEVKTKLLGLMPKLMRVAEESGTDIYFEVHLVASDPDVWAVSQISEHLWPDVKQPEGKVIVRVEDYGRVIGSGIVECNNFFLENRAVLQILDRSQPDPLFQRNLYLTANHEDLYPRMHIHPSDAYRLRMLNSRAILEHGQDEATIMDALSSHLQGQFRESEIVVLDVGGRLEMRKIAQDLADRKMCAFKVWGNELEGIGGIVIDGP